MSARSIRGKFKLYTSLNIKKLNTIKKKKPIWKLEGVYSLGHAYVDFDYVQFELLDLVTLM